VACGPSRQADAELLDVHKPLGLRDCLASGLEHLQMLVERLAGIPLCFLDRRPVAETARQCRGVLSATQQAWQSSLRANTRQSVALVTAMLLPRLDGILE